MKRGWRAYDIVQCDECCIHYSARLMTWLNGHRKALCDECRNDFYEKARKARKSRDMVRSLVARAFRKGELKRRHCEICHASPLDEYGKSWVVAHHDDYGYPLAVRWLCKPHHSAWHKLFIAEG